MFPPPPALSTTSRVSRYVFGFVKVSSWEIKQGIWFLFLLDNNALLDAILGSPNYNINNLLIIKNNNSLYVFSNIC